MIYIDEKFINERIMFLRNQKGISARDLSLSIGQNENYINLIENYKSLPSLRGLILICEYFGITLQEFFDVENKNPNESRKLFDDIKSLDKSTLQALSTIIDAINKKN